jgi:hypothetical protein
VSDKTIRKQTAHAIGNTPVILVMPTTTPIAATANAPLLCCDTGTLPAFS